MNHVDNAEQFDPPLDKGIEAAVKVLRAGGIETFESCEGGVGHSYPEPTVRFHGDYSEGFRAFAVATLANLPVTSLRRLYSVTGGELKGPWWELTFSPTTAT